MAEGDFTVARSGRGLPEPSSSRSRKTSNDARCCLREKQGRMSEYSRLERGSFGFTPHYGAKSAFQTSFLKTARCQPSLYSKPSNFWGQPKLSGTEAELYCIRSQAQRQSTSQAVGWTATTLMTSTGRTVTLPNGARIVTASVGSSPVVAKLPKDVIYPTYLAPYGELELPLTMVDGLRLQIEDRTGQYHTAVDLLGVIGKPIRRNVFKKSQAIKQPRGSGSAALRAASKACSAQARIANVFGKARSFSVILFSLDRDSAVRLSPA